MNIQGYLNQVTGANQTPQKSLSTDLVNTKLICNLEIACNNWSSKNLMCRDLFSEQTPRTVDSSKQTTPVLQETTKS